ncbi:MAG: glycosyltransferase [Verrucomicrobia bacterium]|nr:glycosyltransferase [Verrucomicrobiota bacterium]
MRLSVIVPTHNPHPGRLRRTLLGLRAQTLPTAGWETILVNNASTAFPPEPFFADCAPPNFRVVPEPALGLTAARQCGFLAARGEFAVLVDDDNVLAPDYLAQTLALFATHPRVGALGGKSLPEFESPPAAWTHEFHGLLALRDLGDQPLLSHGLRPAGAPRNEYPMFAPLGAGMALRRAAWTAWFDSRRTGGSTLSDRRGTELTSSGDNDIVLALMRTGWEVGYFPALSLTHLIPASRLDADYLARLNRGIQKSWQQVLALHDASPWPPLSPTGAALRRARAWFTHRAWSSPVARIRWQGACGHFDGRVPSR